MAISALGAKLAAFGLRLTKKLVGTSGTLTPKGGTAVTMYYMETSSDESVGDVFGGTGSAFSRHLQIPQQLDAAGTAFQTIRVGDKFTIGTTDFAVANVKDISSPTRVMWDVEIVRVQESVHGGRE